jgi:hypothetical protein
MARSVVESVDSKDPCAKLAEMSESELPRPTCAVPAEVATVWLRISWKVTRLALKPTVFTLAMLSPMTVMAFPKVLSPLTPENNELVKDIFLYLLCPHVFIL